MKEGYVHFIGFGDKKYIFNPKITNEDIKDTLEQFKNTIAGYLDVLGWDTSIECRLDALEYSTTIILPSFDERGLFDDPIKTLHLRIKTILSVVIDASIFPNLGIIDNYIDMFLAFSVLSNNLIGKLRQFSSRVASGPENWEKLKDRIQKQSLSESMVSL